MAKKIDTKDWSDTDRRYGWKFGCDGLVSSVEAAQIIGKSQPWISAILNSETRKRVNGRGFPIRAARDAECSRLWRICVRSLNEYIAKRQPIEV